LFEVIQFMPLGTSWEDIWSLLGSAFLFVCLFFSWGIIAGFFSDYLPFPWSAVAALGVGGFTILPLLARIVGKVKAKGQEEIADPPEEEN
jgi:hypothetical protein